jgi:pyruvate/2-oxoglutarate dehydrogenase complex dihydrolipoamide dehydrogenase (E3) component
MLTPPALAFGPTWPNPTPAGVYDLLVIGAGPAGLTAAHTAAAFGARVALVERYRLGGGSLNVGSTPSKAILRTARLYAEMGRAEEYGGREPGDIEIDFAAAMDRMRRVRARVSDDASAERLIAAGVDLFFGQARFTGPRAAEIDGVPLRFGKAVIATGSRPLRPDIPGLAEAGYLTNESVFELTERPRRLLVMGGGPLGCELAQAFARLGSYVIIAQDDPTFLPREERDAAQILSEALGRDGIEVHLNTTVTAVRCEAGQKIVELVSEDSRIEVGVDQILVGVGRSPNVEAMNLEAAGVDFDTIRGIKVDDFLRTTNRRIHAAGDVCLEHKFAHAAEASARIAAVNALGPRRERLSRLIVPWCTYTDPEIAHVGLYVRDAWRRSIPAKTYVVLMHDVDRAVTDGEDEGFVKIHVQEGKDRILGATIVARHAGEMIGEVSLAIRLGLGMRDLAEVIHPFPTQAGAVKLAATAHTRAHPPASQRLSRRLRLIGRAVRTRWAGAMRARFRPSRP